jgi:hypothetical protein
MITIPLQLSDELAQQVIPLQDRLPEIIELGLRQLRGRTAHRPTTGGPALKQSGKQNKPSYIIHAQDLQDYIRKEMAALGSEYRPMQANDPFIGGLSVKEYFALPDAEQERLWTEQHRMGIDDFNEREARPDAQVPAR